MENELEKKRKQRAQKKHKPKEDPGPALAAMLTTMVPKMIEGAIEELRDEIIQADRENKRRRERLAIWIKAGPALEEALRSIPGLSPTG